MNRRKFLKLLGIGSATVAGGVVVGKVAEASDAFDVPHIDYLTSPSSYFTDQPSLAIPAQHNDNDPIPYAAPSPGPCPEDSLKDYGVSIKVSKGKLSSSRMFTELYDEAMDKVIAKREAMICTSLQS